jgi:hypothetical protein
VVEQDLEPHGPAVSEQPGSVGTEDELVAGQRYQDVSVL